MHPMKEKTMEQLNILQLQKEFTIGQKTHLEKAHLTS